MTRAWPIIAFKISAGLRPVEDGVERPLALRHCVAPPAGQGCCRSWPTRMPRCWPTLLRTPRPGRTGDGSAQWRCSATYRRRLWVCGHWRRGCLPAAGVEIRGGAAGNPGRGAAGSPGCGRAGHSPRSARQRPAPRRRARVRRRGLRVLLCLTDARAREALIADLRYRQRAATAPPSDAFPAAQPRRSGRRRRGPERGRGHPPAGRPAGSQPGDVGAGGDRARRRVLGDVSRRCPPGARRPLARRRSRARLWWTLAIVALLSPLAGSWHFWSQRRPGGSRRRMRRARLRCRWRCRSPSPARRRHRRRPAPSWPMRCRSGSTCGCPRRSSASPSCGPAHRPPRPPIVAMTLCTTTS